jgi:gluconokinase
MIILLMGVAGAGKTTAGRVLAAELRWRFADADDYHSEANVAKMRAGIPLTDEDRAPWLEALHSVILSWQAAGESVVLACSALKATYRDTLLVNAEVKLVYLRASRELIAARLAARHGHFLDPHLLASQFDILEEPRATLDTLVVDAGKPVEQTVAGIRRGFAL